jgi:DNA-directed RNA polymerase alpha subunit
MTPLFYKYDISVRAGNALTRGNITTTEELKAKTESELLMIKVLSENPELVGG